MYNSAQEVMEALLAGRKVRNIFWNKNDFLYMKDGKLFSNDGVENECFQPNLYNSWEEYVEKPKKVKLYIITSSTYGDSYIVAACSKKEARTNLYNYICPPGRDHILHSEDILSVKHSKCELLKLESKSVIYLHHQLDV